MLIHIASFRPDPTKPEQGTGGFEWVYKGNPTALKNLMDFHRQNVADGYQSVLNMNREVPLALLTPTITDWLDDKEDELFEKGQS